MAIYESLYFSYAGRYSTDFGIINVSINEGMFEEPFVATRVIHETSIRGRDRPYYHGVSYEPLEFSLSFAFSDKYNSDKIREVARWLMQEYYQPLYFSENQGRIFYCMPVGDSKLIHNGLREGYLTINMRCDSPFSYSPIYTDPVYDFSNNLAEGSVINFENLGDIDCYPEIWMEKIGLGSLKIINETTGKYFEFEQLGHNVVGVENETIYINSERREVLTSVKNIYRLNDFKGDFLKAKFGVNVLRVFGDCKITLRYQFRTLQG